MVSTGQSAQVPVNEEAKLEVPVDVEVNAAPSALLQYLLGTRVVIGDFDRHIQGYEFQVFTTLSIMASVGIGVVGLFYTTHPAAAVFLVIGIGVTGLLVDWAYYRRMAYFAQLQAETMQTVAEMERAFLPRILRSNGVRGSLDPYMLTQRLQKRGSARQQLLTVRLTVLAFGAIFVATVVVAASLLV